MKYIIYKITNSINGKIYIGYTSKSFEERFKRHCISSRRKVKGYFHRALCKYGKENFSHEIIYESYDKEHIKDSETLLIDYFNSNNRNIGYNQHRGGSGGSTTLGRKHSEEQKKRIGDFHRGKKLSAEHILFLKNRIVSEETRQKLRAKVCSQETRMKISEKCKGRIVSEETRQKLSDINKGKILSEGHKQKLRDRIITEETKLKQSLARKGKYEGSNNTFFGKKHSEESRKKIGQREYKKGAENYEWLITSGKRFSVENHPRSKKIIINGIYYSSISEAAKMLGLGKKLLMGRVKRFGDNLTYIDGEWAANRHDDLPQQTLVCP